MGSFPEDIDTHDHVRNAPPTSHAPSPRTRRVSVARPFRPARTLSDRGSIDRPFRTCFGPRSSSLHAPSSIAVLFSGSWASPVDDGRALRAGRTPSAAASVERFGVERALAATATNGRDAFESRDRHVACITGVFLSRRILLYRNSSRSTRWTPATCALARHRAAPRKRARPFQPSRPVDLAFGSQALSINLDSSISPPAA